MKLQQSLLLKAEASLWCLSSSFWLRRLWSWLLDLVNKIWYPCAREQVGIMVDPLHEVVEGVVKVRVQGLLGPILQLGKTFSRVRRLLFYRLVEVR